MPRAFETNVESTLFRIIRDLGYDPTPIILGAGFSPHFLQDSLQPISTSRFANLLQYCAKTTGCGYIGFLLGTEMKLSWLGRAGHIAQNSANIGDALEYLVVHVNRRHRFACVSLHQDQTRVHLTYYPLVQKESQDQWLFCVVGAAVALIRELSGAAWTPLQVTMGVKAPSASRLYDGYVQARIIFEATETELQFDPVFLREPIMHAQPEIRELLQRDIDYSESIDENDLHLDVTRIVRRLIGTGQCSVEKICTTLNIRPRILSNGLAKKGKTLQKIIEEVRFEIAKQLMRNTSLTLGEISARLDYSEISAFTRAFNRWAGMPPGDWRRGGNRV